MPSDTEANTDEIDDYLDSLSPKLRKIIADEIEKQANGLAEDIRTAAPHGETGELADSVRVEDGKDDLEKIVLAGGELTTKKSASGFEYDYALGIEFGNSRVPAQPFFFSTYREKHDDIVAAIQDAVDKALG